MSEATAVGVIQGQLGMAHTWLEGTMADVTAEQAHYQPNGKAQPVGANYAHAVIAEDILLSQFVAGATPLCFGDWAGKLGVSELPPLGDWSDWAKRVQIDLPALRAYAQAVYAHTDTILAGLSAADLDRPVDLSAVNLGQQNVGFLLAAATGNVFVHCGEVSAIKGVQGAKGYPF